MEQRQIWKILPARVRSAVEREQGNCGGIQEIRLRAGQPLVLKCAGRERVPGGRSPCVVSSEEIREIVERASSYSMYAYEEEMRQGFLTIEGGHRVGLAGQVILEGGRIKNLKHISSVNIRVAHEVRGCADQVFPFVARDRQIAHTLIISPPGCGKTTLLRDMVRQISDGNSWVRGMTVGVVDERSEIAACCMGRVQNDLGIRTDILDGCPKAEGMIMLIRSMAPQVIAVDEVGSEEDIRAIEYAMHCGCKMLATIHGLSLEEVKKKPAPGELIRQQRFERYIVLGRGASVEGIYGADGREIRGCT